MEVTSAYILENTILNLYELIVGHKELKGECKIIKKHTNQLDENGDMSFPLVLKPWLGHIQNYFEDCNNILDYIDKPSKDKTQCLIDLSKHWVLAICRCTIIKERVILHFNRSAAFSSVLKYVLQTGKCFGSGENNTSKRFSLKTSIKVEENEDLTLLRLRIIASVTLRLLKNAGYDLKMTEDNNEDESTVCIHFSEKSNQNKEQICIYCGPVIENSNVKKSRTNSDEYYRKRTTDMQLMAQHKYGMRVTSETGWGEFFSELGSAAVIFDMLQNKPSSALLINMNNTNCCNNKGASFILYNCARLAAINRKFEAEVEKKQISQLPAIENVDFSLLIQPEEWELFYNYILPYPAVLKRCIQSFENGKVNPQYLCSFLSGLSSTFSVYYRRVRIVTMNRSHLLPVMFARLYLLQALEQVLHNGLDILDIKPVKQM